MPGPNNDIETNGLPFPYGLTTTQIDHVREQYNKVPVSELARKFFGENSSRNYMRIRNIAMSRDVLGVDNEKITVKLENRKTARRNKYSAPTRYPYGLTDDQLLNLYGEYSAGDGVTMLAKRYFKETTARAYQRIRRILIEGEKMQLVQVRPANPKFTTKKNKAAGYRGDRSTEALLSQPPVRGARKPEVTFKNAGAKAFVEDGDKQRTERLIFAGLVSIHAERLRTAVVKNNDEAVTESYNAIIDALGELNAVS